MPTLRRVVLARQSAARSDGELVGAFVTVRDADAFAELVRRHGPMVLGVCRRLVGDRTAADDAFQAVFLVLARRASAVRPREQVGNWLYGVAYRTALKARMVLARRRSREKQVDVMPEPTAPARTDWTDVLPVIDEELAKLPDKLRVPVVLCDLEGRPQREVAKHLNVPAATLATRLASARRTLAVRLSRRGVTLSGGALASLLGTHAAASAVPPALADGLARAAEVVVAGGALDSLVSANAVQLSEGVMRMMMLAKLKAVAVTAVTALALTTGLGLGLLPANAGDSAPTEPGSGPTATAKPAPHGQTAPAAQPQTVGTIDVLLTAQFAAAPEPDDATFLRRLCLDLRGTPATPMEMHFFVADEDGNKRAKVVEWLTDDDAVRAVLAKKFRVNVNSLRVVRLKATGDGKYEVIADGKRGDVLLVIGTNGKHFAVLADGTVQRNANWAKVFEGADNKDLLGALGAWIDLDNDGQPDIIVTEAQRLLQKRDAQADGKRFKLRANSPQDGTFQFELIADDPKAGMKWLFNEIYLEPSKPSDSDAEFLKRVLTDVRGNAPTALELKYFTEDKDPKKREKLLDTLLKDAALQKKLGEAWKAKMLAPKAAILQFSTNDRLFLNLNVAPNNQKDLLLLTPSVIQPPAVPQPPKPPAPVQPPAVPQVNKFEKLVGELIAAKKSDAEILEAITLATLSRLPTDSEKKLTLASISTASDRKAAWINVAKALAGTEETKKPAGGLRIQFGQSAPQPPAKP
jgi:RNA polymerase sigma factor (sigma-70 family)